MPLLLIGRNLVVAGLQQALPGQDFNYTPIEHPKIALNFLGVGLLLAPIGVETAGLWTLAASAALSVVTMALYARRAAPGFQISPAPREPAGS